ncbi:MAG TPA: hypothetical protein VKX17_09880 [Planctomycetota bacterium]|nr:hypothetical protein [Planctomycetota bacterium]
MTTCSRCQRNLFAEKPVHLPDSRDYCAACCESMATDSFEMETGERFTQWIEKHPRLVMRYQPMELSVRRLSFFFPLAAAVGGIAVFGIGCVKYIVAGLPLLYLALGVTAILILAALILTYPKASARLGGGFGLLALKLFVTGLSLAAPIVALLGMIRFGRPVGFIVLGLSSILLFGWLASRGLVAFMRAQNFELTLEDGVFHLTHGPRAETFGMDDVERACVVRPGTIGATEGALGLKNGLMLTLDTCLSDLHALGVVMDLHFNREFPPSAEDLARVRRDKLRKIRGLS